MNKGQERSILFALTLFAGALVGSGITQIAINVDYDYDANKTPIGLMDRQTFEGELTYPTQKDEGRSGLAELDYGEDTLLEQCVNEYNKLNEECK